MKRPPLPLPRVGRNGRHRGAALLAAMLTVALVATFAAAALWQQWRSIEVESAERARVQAGWVLTGGLDWARLLLQEDAKGSKIDHLGEPWAVPLQEARLSSFLAADRNTSTSFDNDPGVMDAFLSGQIVDLQSMMNVANLVGSDGKVPVDWLASFTRLFETLGLPQSQLEKLAENLRFAMDRSAANGSSPLAPLMPQRVDQLVWLGLPESTVAALKPYVTMLPDPSASPTPINLNTASAEVISACLPGVGMAEAQRLVAVRASAPFNSPEDARAAIGADKDAFTGGTSHVGVATGWFEVRSRLRLDKLMVVEHSIVQRDTSGRVTVKQRWRGPVTPDAPATPAAPGTMATDGTMR
jgi:general secretion pathway protein K